jgi:PAS domain S-box-containing protein
MRAALAVAAIVSAALPLRAAEPAERPHFVDASSNNFPPINLLDDERALTGFGRDLADAVIDAVGGTVTHMHSPVWTNVLEWLDTGRADFIHDTGYTPDRTSFLDFSEPILEMPEEIFVLSDRFDVQSLESLTGKRVACVNKHITHLYLQKIPDINCHIFKTPPEAVQALLDGRVDAFIYPRQIVLYYAHQLNVAYRIKQVGEPLRTLTWHMVVKKGNAKMLLLLNRGIAKVKASGEYQRIYDKWFGRAIFRGYTTGEVLRIVGSIVLVALAAGLAFAAWTWILRRTVIRRTAELNRSEGRFRATFEQAAVGIAHVGPDGRWQRVNRRLCDIVGYTREELLERTFQDITHPDDLDTDLGYLQQVLAGEIPTYSREKRYIRKDGSTVWINLTVALVRRASGEPGYFISVVEDISERKAAEDEIRALNEQLEQRVRDRTGELTKAKERAENYLAVAGTMIVALDRNGCVSLINRKGCEVLGYGESELLGRNWFDTAIPRDQRDMVSAVFANAMAGEIEPVEQFENHVVTRDGELRLIAWFNTLLKNDDGSIVGGLSSGLDVTERRHAEEELKTTQEQLIKQERLAVLGQLTGTVAHELRNPLGTVATSFSTIRRLCPEADENLQNVFARGTRSIGRCDRIITELLDFARAKGPNRAPTDVDVWLAGLLDDQELPVGIKLRRELHGSGTTVPFDGELLRRAVVNVVENACQAMTADSADGADGASLELVVSTRFDGDRLEIEFADNGPGVEPDALSHILEPLFSTKAFGVGLGLPIAQQIMEQHEGGLEIMSEKDKGTRAILWLPLAEAHSEVKKLA